MSFLDGMRGVDKMEGNLQASRADDISDENGAGVNDLANSGENVLSFDQNSLSGIDIIDWSIHHVEVSDTKGEKENCVNSLMKRSASTPNASPRVPLKPIQFNLQSPTPKVSFVVSLIILCFF